MVFNSLTFMLFFVCVWTLHQLPLRWSIKKFNLLVAGYLFYAAWNPPFVLLLIISALADFFLAQWMSRTDGTLRRRLILAASLTLNLGVLAYFKYGGFLLDIFISAVKLVGIRFQAAAPDIILPLGISFYTFETISYLIDVYRGRIKAWNSFLDYALFLNFFPHLVAGPIVRPSDFLPQCSIPRRATTRQLGWGLSMLTIGLVEKVVLADAMLAPVADKVYASTGKAGFVDAWVGTLAFSAQIFFDFAGYSTCAIGVALCLGFVLNDNFHFPYAAVGFSDFWRRWHISLSSWLRDYLYFPLGGNRKGTIRTYVNLMATMLLGGLWHGANWRFVAWGGLHGFYLACEHLIRSLTGGTIWSRRSAVQIPLALSTYGLVCITWVFFRAESFGKARHLLESMATVAASAHLVSRVEVVTVLCITATMLAAHWLLRHTSLEHTVDRLPWWLRALALALLMVSLALAPGDDRAFIYFQF
jgi:D-alanyl-lipoteichoic acid acyltransferase DltB (MBOAT superfamily)